MASGGKEEEDGKRKRAGPFLQSPGDQAEQEGEREGEGEGEGERWKRSANRLSGAGGRISDEEKTEEKRETERETERGGALQPEGDAGGEGRQRGLGSETEEISAAARERRSLPSLRRRGPDHLDGKERWPGPAGGSVGRI